MVLIVTDRLPCATAQAASVTAWFITTEPVRALITTLAAGVASSTSRFSISARKATRASADSGMRTRIDAAVERLGGAGAHAAR